MNELNALTISLTPFQLIVVIAFLIMTIIGFAAMGIDKAKAKSGTWRVKESTLFTIAALFGGVGTTIGMLVFRHKTKHWYFVVFMPLLAVINVLAIGFLLSLSFSFGITPLV